FKCAKGAPVQSNSNIWFVEPDRLARLGPAIGRGSVWLRDDLKAGQVSDPYLFAGYDYRMMTIKHGNPSAVTFTLEVDRKGNNQWEKIESIKVDGALVHIFKDSEQGAWVRVSVDADVKEASVHFNYRNKDQRTPKNNDTFNVLAQAGEKQKSKGVIRSNRKVLSMVSDNRYYELDDKLELTAKADDAAKAVVAQGAQTPHQIRVDAASVIVEEAGMAYRIPKNPMYEASDAKPSPVASQKKLEDYLSLSLSKGAAVKVSSTAKNSKADHLVDGVFSEESRWIAQGSSSWLALDMGSAKRFQSVYVATGLNREPQYAAKNFDVQIKKDGAWVTLQNGAIRNNNSVIAAVKLESPVTAQELRVDFKDIGYIRVYEVAVFADQPVISGAEESSHSQQDFARVCREVATERDLFNFHGTFYELPARNAQGFAKIRPIATHNLNIHDYGSHFGMLFMTGLNGQANDRVVKSADGTTALWAGVIDDLWQLGKPRGEGGVWKESPVKANVPSDPYLMTGFDKKSATLQSSVDAQITLEIDIDGTGLWMPCQTFSLKAGTPVQYAFPEGFSAYWVRAVSSVDTTATVMFKYE
ncbi:MAG: discoidin domain-containing protein, partial [bacterium]